MHFSRIILALTASIFVIATPPGVNYNLRRTDGGDDNESPTCPEALKMLPECALKCITQPPIDEGCKSAADFACTCEKKTSKRITKAETPCVLKECGIHQALVAQKAGKAICEACNTSPNDGHDDGHGDDGHGDDGNGDDGY